MRGFCLIFKSQSYICGRGVLGALASCTLRPTLSFLLGHVVLVRKRLHYKARNKLTLPNERGSVGWRVQKASVPSTAHKQLKDNVELPDY
ncbi:hypothetical protein SLEP1_g43742 [Rubroshorea leprosula]|uniref:Uncharacterized protein n=1 Tax=Rubroshorea leprosula TaxID=152421 RepID=A0AAV5LE01_9ROSI|nr:hypothetical protein SLEP1_g43742 [Rubroshorea leprosula]